MKEWGLDDLAYWTIAVGVTCNIPCAILGCYLVLRRMSLLGDAISHAVLPGIALGYLMSGRLAGLGIVFGAMAFGLLTAILTQTLNRFGRLPEDASMGVVFTSLFALGVILITNAAADVDLDPGCVLYGLIEFTPLDTYPIFGFEIPRAVLTLGTVTLVAVGFVTCLWKELKIAAFDPDLATAMGLNATLLHYLLMTMIAIVTVAAFEAVGSILVVAMLIVPAAAAHLLTDRLLGMLIMAVVIGVLSAVGGYFGAVAVDTSVAGMMAVVAGGFFGLAVLFAPRHGILSRGLHTLRLALRIAGEDVLAFLYRIEEDRSRIEKCMSVVVDECLEVAGRGITGRLALGRLRLRRQIVVDPEGRVGLSPEGRRVANELVRSHRLWESYLSVELRLPSDHLHAPAERIEHYIGPTLQEQIVAQLEMPDADPHGRTIPSRAESGQTSSD